MILPSAFADVRRVGSGGLGDVYYARRTSSGTDVAIKVLRQTHGSAAVLRRANREREALASLRGHPNVVHLEEVLETVEGEIVLVMEYMAGGSVDTFTGDDGTMPLDEVLLIGESAANALSAAHGRGIVHRDIKPQNLLVNGFGHVKVCDFGISSLGASAEFADRTDALSYRFASPEEIRGEERIGPLTDVYSLGVTLAYLLTGRHFNHEVAPTLLETPGDSATADDEGSPDTELRSLLVQCMAAVPRDRPDSETLARRLAALGASLGRDRARRLRLANPDHRVQPLARPEPPTTSTADQTDVTATMHDATTPAPAALDPVSRPTPTRARTATTRQRRRRKRAQKIAAAMWVVVAVLLIVLVAVILHLAGVFD